MSSEKGIKSKPGDLMIATVYIQRPRWQFWNRKPKMFAFKKLVKDKKWSQITTRISGAKGVTIEEES